MRPAHEQSQVSDYADIARNCPSKSITQLAWRHRGKGSGTSPVTPDDIEDKDTQPAFELAVGSEDTSVRIYSISKLDVEI